MERLKRLTSLWAWLPTFRAVAEEQHVSRAAEQLGVSPSAVSRMLGLLEDDVGQPLFNRVGRRIQLNAAGAHLLSGVRSAMRLVDESLSLVAGSQFVGPVVVSSAEPVTRSFLLPALEELRAAHPALIPTVRSALDEQVAGMLLRGELDVAFVSSAPKRAQLSLKKMGELSSAVYAGTGHPLHRRRRCDIDAVTAHAFVAVDTWGGWPAGYRREVTLGVTSVELAAELCAEGELLAVLPDVVAKRHAGLRKLPQPFIPPRTVYAVWRERLELVGRAEAVVDSVKRRFSSAI